MTYAKLCGALLALLLAGCQVLPQTTVPESLLALCPHPVVDAGSHAGLAKGLKDYHAALESCNDDKAALRQHLTK